MRILGTIIGIGEIILGIIILFNTGGQAILIGAGIGYILSGILFIWLCAGASLAFENLDSISKLRKDIRKLEKQNAIYLKLFEKAGVETNDVKMMFENSIGGFKEGHPLIALVEKTLVESGARIPKGSELSFVRIDIQDDGSTYAIVDVVVDNVKHRVRYKEEEVISRELYSEEDR